MSIVKANESRHSTAIGMARLAEQTERFEDMVKYVKQVLKEEEDITDEVRNLISIAYKNIVGANRSTWRAVCNLEQKEKEKVGLRKFRNRSSFMSLLGTGRKSKKN